MYLSLGERTYDLATRSLVVGTLDGRSLTLPAMCVGAERLRAHGADVIEVELEGGEARPAVAALVDGLAVPVAVRTTDPAVATAAYQAGAVLGPGDGTALARAAADAGVTAIATSPSSAREAVAAGLAPTRLVLDIGPYVRPTPEAVDLGCALLCTAATGWAGAGAGDGAAAARTALAVIGGCRLVRTADVRAARRICDVLAAVLEIPA